MATPHFNSEEERKEFWAGWLEVRGTVWNVLKAEGNDHPTLEQYFAKGEELSEEYIARWGQTHTQTPSPLKGGEGNEVEEVVTPTADVTEVSTPMEPTNYEAPEIEENETPSNSPLMGRTDEQRAQIENSLPIKGEGRREGLCPATVFKVVVCLASFISALCVGGWIWPFVCATPLFMVVAYEHEKMQKAMVVYDSPALYQYGTRSHE